MGTRGDSRTEDPLCSCITNFLHRHHEAGHSHSHLSHSEWHDLEGLIVLLRKRAAHGDRPDRDEGSSILTSLISHSRAHRHRSLWSDELMVQILAGSIPSWDVWYEWTSPESLSGDRDSSEGRYAWCLCRKLVMQGQSGSSVRRSPQVPIFVSDFLRKVHTEGMVRYLDLR